MGTPNWWAVGQNREYRDWYIFVFVDVGDVMVNVLLINKKEDTVGFGSDRLNMFGPGQVWTENRAAKVFVWVVDFNWVTFQMVRVVIGAVRVSAEMNRTGFGFMDE